MGYRLIVRDVDFVDEYLGGSMKKVITALAKMVTVFGIMAVSSFALYMEYVRKHN